MRSTIAIFSLVASALALAVPKPNIVARAVYPRQSTDVCIFDSCPATDQRGVGNDSGTTTGTTFSCSYSGETCDYDTTTDKAFAGNPAECPTMAEVGGCDRRRRAAQYTREDNYTTALRKIAAREAARRA